jgi:YD repeat-containing protein
VSVDETDDRGHLLFSQAGDLAPTTYDYDDRDRLTTAVALQSR